MIWHARNRTIQNSKLKVVPLVISAFGGGVKEIIKRTRKNV